MVAEAYYPRKVTLMPTYEFICKKCEQRFERVTKIADREKPESEPCPNAECGESGHIERYMGGQHYELTDSWSLGRLKTPKPWREFLSRMASANPGSRINSD